MELKVGIHEKLNEQLKPTLDALKLQGSLIYKGMLVGKEDTVLTTEMVNGCTIFLMAA